MAKKTLNFLDDLLEPCSVLYLTGHRFDSCVGILSWFPAHPLGITHHQLKAKYSVRVAARLKSITADRSNRKIICLVKTDFSLIWACFNLELLHGLHGNRRWKQ